MKERIEDKKEEGESSKPQFKDFNLDLYLKSILVKDSIELEIKPSSLSNSPIF
jgi:hypothetical protein